MKCVYKYGTPGGTVVKILPASTGDARDTVLIPGSGRSPRVENGSPLQYSRLENHMAREEWRTTAQCPTQSQKCLSTTVGDNGIFREKRMKYFHLLQHGCGFFGFIHLSFYYF